MKNLIRCLMVVVVVAGGVAVAQDANDPLAPHAPGIYYFTEAGGQRQMTKIAPDSFSKTKGGFAFFGGFGEETKQKAVVAGAHAELQIAEARPVFYFYISAAAGGLGEEAAVTPDDFALSEMQIKKEKNERRLTIGKVGVYSGAKMGADKKAVRQFAVEKAGEGIYKVSVTQDLKPGEYCFFRPIAGQGTFFPFGVQGAAK